MFLVLTMVLMCFSGCDVHDSKSQHREDDVVEEPKTPTTNTTANGPTMTDEYAAVLDRAVMLLAGCGTCFVNGRMVTIEGAIPAKIDGVMYIPAVFVAERLGGLAERTDNGFALTINGQTITLEITGEDTVKLNGNKIGGYDADSDVIVEAKPLTDAMKTDVIASGDLLVLGDGLNENAASINPDAQTLLLDSIATQLQTKDVITTVSGTSVEAPTDQFDGAYGQIRRWSFDDSDIPIKSKENELAAVLGPLCVENVKITDLASEDGAHRCSFTVYNCLGYTYGAVEVYDGNGEWQETVVIEPYEGQ